MNAINLSLIKIAKKELKRLINNTHIMLKLKMSLRFKTFLLLTTLTSLDKIN